MGRGAAPTPRIRQPHPRDAPHATRQQFGDFVPSASLAVRPGFRPMKELTQEFRQYPWASNQRIDLVPQIKYPGSNAQPAVYQRSTIGYPPTQLPACRPLAAETLSTINYQLST